LWWYGLRQKKGTRRETREEEGLTGRTGKTGGGGARERRAGRRKGRENLAPHGHF